MALAQPHRAPAGDAEAVREERLDTEETLALASTTADDIEAVAQRLATTCVATLEHRLASATSKSSARGTSLSITMHELRRPLTILNSYGQLLSAGMLGALPETAMVAIEGITASTEMMVRMVNALAELARLEDPDDQLALEVMDAEEVVAEAIEHVAMEAKLRESTITSECEHGLIMQGRPAPPHPRADQPARQRGQARPDGLADRGDRGSRRPTRCASRSATMATGFPVADTRPSLRQVLPVGRRAAAQGARERPRSVYRAYCRGAARGNRGGPKRRREAAPSST